MGSMLELYQSGTVQYIVSYCIVLCHTICLNSTRSILKSFKLYRLTQVKIEKDQSVFIVEKGGTYGSVYNPDKKWSYH